MTDRPAFVFVEHVLWEPGTAWDAAVESLATRFARSAPLDVAAVRGAGPLHAQLALLEAWAAGAGADLDRELGRWLDEHLAMHVRPAPSITRAVRALAADGPVHLVSALPPRAAESVARHAGCWRSASKLHARTRDADGIAALAAELDPRTVVAAASTPLPAGVDASPLLQPAN